MKCILGIDSGGTKCESLFASEDGQALGWGASAPGTHDGERIFGGFGRTRRAVLHSIATAMGNTPCEELHIAMFGSILPPEFGKTLPSTRIVTCSTTEYDAAMAQVDRKTGIVVLAGTGAFVYAVAPGGKTLRLDGLGPLLGDHGGGYEIGLEAIRAAARSGWHPRHATAMTGPIFKACGGREEDTSGFSLLNYKLAERDRAEIAAFARIVVQAARSGDTVASRIIRKAAEHIAATIEDVADQLPMNDSGHALIGTGGIITNSDLYWTHLCDTVQSFAPRLQAIRTDLPPAVGVTLQALAQMPGIDYPAARNKLLETTRTLLNKERRI